MNRINDFTNRLKFVRLKDLLQVFPALLAATIAPVFKIYHRNIWLVCERATDARDNGYWFFKYLRQYHLEIEAVYAIDKKAPDYNRVASLGKVIQFGSLSHWLYYWAAKKNISSQKEGKPNAALCYILEVYLGFRKNRAYIRHGIVKDDQKWVYYDVTKMNLFATSSKREYDYVNERFGYPEGVVQLTGLCRYDNLLSHHVTKRQILIMPTMREWLRIISKDTLAYEGTFEFTESEFFKTWNSLVKSERLASILDKYNTNLVFYLHGSMQQYSEKFDTGNDRIIIGYARDYEVQKLLMESSVLITDYSSIYFDFAYMKKPLIYYQFDYEKYRRGQYQEGYFSYQDDGFGEVTTKENELLDALEDILVGDLSMHEKYGKRVDDFFAYRDTNNCERTYQAIIKMKK